MEKVENSSYMISPSFHGRTVSVDEDGRNERTEEQVMTGTLEFIAIEILEGALRKGTSGIEHTYRHDLESFFYVFLSVCIRYGWDDGKAPNQNPLHMWYRGKLENISTVKRGYIESGGFDIHVLSKFSPSFELVSEDVAGHPVLERSPSHWHSSRACYPLQSDYQSF